MISKELTEEKARELVAATFKEKPLDVLETVVELLNDVDERSSRMHVRLNHSEMEFKRHRHVDREIVIPVGKHPALPMGYRLAAAKADKATRLSPLQILADYLLAKVEIQREVEEAEDQEPEQGKEDT